MEMVKKINIIIYLLKGMGYDEEGVVADGIWGDKVRASMANFERHALTHEINAMLGMMREIGLNDAIIPDGYLGGEYRKTIANLECGQVQRELPTEWLHKTNRGPDLAKLEETTLPCDEHI